MNAAPSVASRARRSPGIREGPEPKRPSPGLSRSGISRAVSKLVMKLGVDPVHVLAQLLAHGLDLVARLLLAHASEVLLAGAVLGDPFAGELTRLDLVEQLSHRGPRLFSDHAFAARQVAVLGRVRDRVAHARDALLVHQVDD